ncbi:unnamed protein product [Protopolystoma xenopodis]|uniref:Uncharacterized protein n=1 Tax=Protopolystoma xenopodis TaxID=117903 RepID=A0A3S5B9V4_9PLAT|nr:unnamed protein product [Protopolystoma xenopodis]
MIISRVRLWTWYVVRRFGGIVSESCQSQRQTTPHQRDKGSQSIDQHSIVAVAQSILVLSWPFYYFLPSIVSPSYYRKLVTCLNSTKRVPFRRIYRGVITPSVCLAPLPFKWLIRLDSPVRIISVYPEQTMNFCLWSPASSRVDY